MRPGVCFWKVSQEEHRPRTQQVLGGPEDVGGIQGGVVRLLVQGHWDGGGEPSVGVLAGHVGGCVCTCVCMCECVCVVLRPENFLHLMS